MFDVNVIRKDFPMLNNNSIENKSLIYLDNAATTLKPQIVINAVCDYLSNYTSSVHRGDYDLSYQVDTKYEQARKDVAKFIGSNENEVVFTSGTSDSINLIAFGFALNYLKKGDEILLTVSEHASNVVPWFEVANRTGAVIRYIDLVDGQVTVENVKNAISNRTKIIALAQVTNVLGYEVPIKDICLLAKECNVITCVDGAQSAPHMKVDVKDLCVDFFSFSAHKLCGPTGVGVLYGRYELLEITNPTRFGGGSNVVFNQDGTFKLKDAPAKFETGTPNIEGVIGLGAAVNYLMQIGMNYIHNYEYNLRKYAISRMKDIDNITIHNINAIGPIIFSVDGVFSQDVGSLFNKYGIAVRTGQHCAKMMGDILPVSQTIRASLYFYNTYEEVDKFVEVCKKGDDFLDAFFG